MNDSASVWMDYLVKSSVSYIDSLVHEKERMNMCGLPLGSDLESNLAFRVFHLFKLSGFFWSPGVVR